MKDAALASGQARVEVEGAMYEAAVQCAMAERVWAREDADWSAWVRRRAWLALEGENRVAGELVVPLEYEKFSGDYRAANPSVVAEAQ